MATEIEEFKVIEITKALRGLSSVSVMVILDQGGYAITTEARAGLNKVVHKGRILLFDLNPSEVVGEPSSHKVCDITKAEWWRIQEARPALPGGDV